MDPFADIVGLREAVKLSTENRLTADADDMSVTWTRRKGLAHKCDSRKPVGGQASPLPAAP